MLFFGKSIIQGGVGQKCHMAYGILLTKSKEGGDRMNRKIMSAIVVEGNPLSFVPGINILWGEEAEDVLRALVSIFCEEKTGRAVKAKVTGRSGVCFHKHRLLERRDCSCVFYGAVPKHGPCMGESDLRLLQFDTFLRGLRKGDERPLFLCNMLDRLDEAVDLRPIFKALNATGRQVFIAVPPDYKIKALEEKPCVTIIRTF
jgi:hypothetical protein